MYLADGNLIGFLGHVNALHLLEQHADVLRVEPVIAGHLRGRSLKAIRKAVDSGALLAGPTTHRRIAVTDLANDRLFTTDDWQRVAKSINRRGPVHHQDNHDVSRRPAA